MVPLALFFMAAFFLYVHQKPPEVVAPTHIGCRQIVVSPAVYACVRNVFIVEDNGTWTNIGPISKSVPVPLGGG